MSVTVLAFTAYVFLTLILLVAIVSSRTLIVMGGKRAPNEFKPDADGESSFLQRLTRAHANVVECFPFVGGMLLLAIAMEKPFITDGLAPYVILARLAQTLTHLLSTSAVAVQIRFAFFLVQVAICIYWCAKIFGSML
jgi:hypothetical protein